MSTTVANGPGLGTLQESVLRELRAGPLDTSALLDRLLAAGAIAPGPRPSRLSSVRTSCRGLQRRGLVEGKSIRNPLRPAAVGVFVWALVSKEVAEGAQGQEVAEVSG